MINNLLIPKNKEEIELIKIKFAVEIDKQKRKKEAFNKIKNIINDLFDYCEKSNIIT